MKLDEGRKWVGRRGGAAARFLKAFVLEVLEGAHFVVKGISIAFTAGFVAALLWGAVRFGWMIGGAFTRWIP